MSASSSAKKVIEIVKKAIASHEPHVYFNRKFESYFENHNGDEVVFEFMKLYHEDEYLKRNIEKVCHWIDIDYWETIYQEQRPKHEQSTLF